jgi:hypothetical protein
MCERTGTERLPGVSEKRVMTERLLKWIGAHSQWLTALALCAEQKLEDKFKAWHEDILLTRSPLSNPVESAPLARVRDDLQDWFSASITDMAKLLGMSYATFANIAKVTRAPRAGSLRKILSVHGRAKELRKMWGAQRAEAWLKTIGRETLTRALRDFEITIDRILFATAEPERIGARAAKEENQLFIDARGKAPATSGARRR